MYRLDSRLLNQRVNVVVVGAGGTGSHVVADLAVLHQALMDLGHPAGLRVTLIDGDIVSEANCVRARFYPADVGLSKSQVLCHRINMCYGLDFEAVHGMVDSESRLVSDADVVFGCVDTRSSRRAIHSSLRGDQVRKWRDTIWIDMGNGENDGQVVLGVVGSGRTDGQLRPPTVTDLYPDMLDEGLDPKDDGPSCSRREAIERQGVFVNKAAALHGVNMLATLLRSGKLEYSACFFNISSGRVVTLACEAEAWKRFGYLASEATT